MAPCPRPVWVGGGLHGLDLVEVVLVLVLHAELGQPGAGVEGGALAAAAEGRTPHVALEPVGHVASVASVVAALNCFKSGHKNCEKLQCFVVMQLG